MVFTRRISQVTNKYLEKIASLFSQAEHAVLHTAAHGMENQKNYPEESVTKRRFIGIPSINNDLKTKQDAAINNTNSGALIVQ